MKHLDSYLAQCYRRDVMGQRIEVVPPQCTPEMRAEAKQRIAHFDSLHLGASLANRDFVSYQNRRALAGLLAHWEEQDAAQSRIRPSSSEPKHQGNDR